MSAMPKMGVKMAQPTRSDYQKNPIDLVPVYMAELRKRGFVHAFDLILRHYGWDAAEWVGQHCLDVGRTERLNGRIVSR